MDHFLKSFSKYIPNILSISRIVLSVTLFFFLDDPFKFTPLYLICGFSDIADGYLARKWKVQSKLGAKLDSVADLFLFTVIIVTIFKGIGNGIFKYLPILILITAIRFLNIAIAAFKYHTFAILHTWGNKLTGFLSFFIPFGILFGSSLVLWIICFLALLAALEESVIHLTAKDLNLDRKSIVVIRGR